LIMPRLSTKALPMEGLQLWPNPARDAMNLKLRLESGTVGCTVELLDALGRVVLAEKLPVNGQELRTILGLEAVESGAYWLRISLTEASGVIKTLAHRLQVQH